jgi:hypothetical protein
MRSELVFKALVSEPNRYRLVRLLANGTRKMHRPNTRLQDTTNEVMERFHSSGPRVEVHRVEPAQEERRAA